MIDESLQIKKLDNTYNKTEINLNKDDFASYKEYKKEYDKQYSKLTRGRRKDIYQLNIDYKRAQSREYRKNNPEKTKEINEKRNENYYKNKQLQKISIERGWKKAGIIFFEETFDEYHNQNNCQSCGIEFIKGKGQGHNRKNLDHDHFSGYVRNIICQRCNIYRRKRDTDLMKIHLELYRYFNNK